MGAIAGVLADEPVRLRMYAVVVAAVALLVHKGVLDPQEADMWLGLVVAVLAVESSRSKVSPVPSGKHIEHWGLHE